MNAAFFDMDGTLIDSRADLAATVNHTRRDFELPEMAQDDVLAHVGRGARRLLAETLRDAAAPEEEVFEVFMKHYSEHMLEAVELYPGVRRTLDELRERGWRLGVNTAKPRFATMAILEHFGLTSLFKNAIVAGGDCAEHKPSALPLRECASRMGGHRLNAHDWMVGDNWTDVECARNAGVKSAFCTYGFGVLSEAAPTAKISRIDQLLRHLGNLED